MDNTLQILPVLVVGFTASLGLTPLSRQIAFRLGVVDKPNQRKIHQDFKPLMGGLAIDAAFMLAVVLFSPPQYFVQLFAVLSGCVLLALTGLLDDRFELSSESRLVVQFFTAGLVIAAGIHLTLFNNPWLDYPITAIWIVAITNALNFMDNMDGLCAGTTAISAGVFLVIALLQGLSLVSLLAAALLGSAVGFLIHNYNPASTFMGDMGALVLGYVLAVLAIKVDYWIEPLGPAWVIPLLVLAVPIFDINLVVFSRLAEGHPVLHASKNHTSHRLLSLGLTQRQTLLVMYGLAIFFGAIAIALTAATPEVMLIVGLLSGVLIVTLTGFMIVVRVRELRRIAAALEAAAATSPVQTGV